MTTQHEVTDEIDDLTEDELETDDWAPPTKDEWERIVSEAKKANSEAAARKRMLRDLGYDKNGNKVDDADNDSEESGSASAKKSVKVDTKAVARAVAVKTAAIYSGLAQAGVPAGQLDRMARIIDADSIAVDEDGVEGLTEQIESLRTDYPELFKRQRQKAPDANVVGAGKKTVSKSSESGSWQDEVKKRFNSGLI
ncbi:MULTISPECIES: phage scaffolding protein [unclassified Streptomyces]|uniref:phage scaffolding protein n=1 Tax=unclassified Streptomyces TaxID=2593676 RepID=UPI002E2B3B38|nr:phage scaffolding protein [Streptomyces sp. NBC_00228]